MGLDTVEIILRTEETFAIDLPDSDCAQVRTVGDLYRLVLEKLSLPYQPATETEAIPTAHNRSRLRTVTPFDFTTPDVWLTLKALIIDQLQVKDSEVHEQATFIHDLGCD
ncbi:acyl carrier protein [Granulicella tundricola]|uniref:Carrier domain-containing protein n=1 Tax=Granulicella tundricola (strain ATCC BAA-1859 / DSM 23138 / MP5ACTX9) TaxID=1198114 RepID=E8WXI0_GRATM|nr:hypothetical protein [Granulicella tundricola]ADW68596.1 hypothetical protein AciX9_1543 [Granulicella tundricola MP5ACTX9]